MSREVTLLIQALRNSTGTLPMRKALETLSRLLPDDQAALRESWPAIPVETRLNLLTVLSDMAESDIAFDFGAVFRLAIDDKDEEIQLAALEGLWDDDDEALAPFLIQLLKADPSVAVRASAAMNLGRFAMLGELEEMDPKAAGLVRDALLSAVRSPVEDTEVRRRALEAVSCMDGDDVADLIRAAYREKDEQMNISAVYAMGRSLDEAWAPFVRRELKNARPEIRMEAARAAGELELSDALPELLDMLYDPEARVREAVIEALGNIGSERALQVLGELARSTDESIRYAALDALEVARFNEDPLSPEVLSWLLDRNVVDWDEDDESDDEYDEDWDNEE